MNKLSTNEIIEEIARLIDDSNKLDIDNVSIADNISTWIVGLATGGFLVTLSKLTNEGFDLSESKLLIILLSYLGILIITLILKLAYRSFRTTSHQIGVLYKLLKIRLKNRPELIENDIKENSIFHPYTKFFSGEYFDELIREKYDAVYGSQKIAGRIIVVTFILIIACFILEYIMIYLFLKGYLIG